MQISIRLLWLVNKTIIMLTLRAQQKQNHIVKDLGLKVLTRRNNRNSEQGPKQTILEGQSRRSSKRIKADDPGPKQTIHGSKQTIRTKADDPCQSVDLIGSKQTILGQSRRSKSVSSEYWGQVKIRVRLGYTDRRPAQGSNEPKMHHNRNQPSPNPKCTLTLLPPSP